MVRVSFFLIEIWVEKHEDNCMRFGQSSVLSVFTWTVVVSSLVIVSCGRVQTTSSNDGAIYGSGVTGSSQFLAARAVLANKCFACHSSWGAYNETDFSGHFLVSNGDPFNSLIYYRIRGNDSGTAGDMPTSGPNMTSDEIAVMKTWILSL